MNRSQAEAYARWFRCLADATRLQLLRTLAQAAGPMTIGQLVDAVDVGQSSVSGHVRRLAESEFVFVERAGPTTYVTINADCLTALPDAASAIVGAARSDGPVGALDGSRGTAG